MKKNSVAIRGEWRMNLEYGYYWHACKKGERKTGDIISQQFPENPPKPPYCTNCNVSLPKEDEDFFKATWHLLNFRKKK